MSNRIGLGVLLLLIAAFARLYAFNDAPPGLQHDEIFKAQEGRALIESGDFRLFYPSNQGHEALYVWMLGASYLLFGTSVMTVKFPALMCGLLTVALMYRVVGQIANRRVAFIAAGLTAVSFWAISVSRMGLRANTLPVVALLMVWGLVEVTAARNQPHRTRISLLTGAALGAAIYTYTSAFVVYIAFALLILWLATAQRNLFRASWRQLALVGIVGVLLALPMVAIRLSDPQGTNRVSTITRPLTDFLAGNPDELIGNFWGLVGMPAFTGDPEWRYNVAQRPLFLLPLGLLVYVGFGVAAMRVRRQPILLVLLVFATLGLIPSLLTVSAPSYLRSILALPAVMLFIGLAIDLMPNKRAVWAIGAIAIAVTAAADWTAYFGTWTRNPEVQQIYRDDLEALAGYLRDTDAAQVIASTPDTGLDGLLFDYYQPKRDVIFFDVRTTIVLSDMPHTLLLISPFSPITPPHADWLTSAQGTISLPSILRQDGEVAFEVYQLDAREALAARLTQVQAQPVYLFNETAFQRGNLSTWAGIQQIAYPVNFGGIVQLAGVELPRKQIATQYDGVNIQLYLQPLVAHTDLPLNVFVHMSRRDGTVHAQRDLMGVPPVEWTTEMMFIQDNFVIAGDTPPGNYILTMGVYNFQTGERLPILDAGGAVVGERLVIDRVRVE
jgi:4-amino-4-deoxy-L-arabinose transferase-like glycosyltransferase